GLNGGQSCVDGCSSGRFPPKESVREVHINQNPIAAEYDLMGLGHIEVFRKPGSDKFHGMIALKYGNAVLRSRNPYSKPKAAWKSSADSGTENAMAPGANENSQQSFLYDSETDHCFF